MSETYEIGPYGSLTESRGYPIDLHGIFDDLE